MKKVFFSFVVVAVVALASCNNAPKTEEAVENATESVEAAGAEAAAVVDSTVAAAVDSAVAK